MRDAIGGISLFQIVVLFILLFTGIMCLTINHSKAFGVKDEIITLIENNEVDAYKSGNTYKLKDKTIKAITNHLTEVGYRLTGKCDDDWVGYDRNGNETYNTDNAAFCVKAVNVNQTYTNDMHEKCSNGKCYITSEGFPSMVYYNVKVFYQLDIPIINGIFKFELNGSTKVLFG